MVSFPLLGSVHILKNCKTNQLKVEAYKEKSWSYYCKEFQFGMKVQYLEPQYLKHFS